MATVLQFPASSRPRLVAPRKPEADATATANEIFLAEKLLLSAALENIASVNLELMALSRMADLGLARDLGDQVGEEPLIGMATALVHLIDARGARNIDLPVRRALAELVCRFEGVHA